MKKIHEYYDRLNESSAWADDVESAVRAAHPTLSESPAHFEKDIREVRLVFSDQAQLPMSVLKKLFDIQVSSAKAFVTTCDGKLCIKYLFGDPPAIY